MAAAMAHGMHLADVTGGVPSYVWGACVQPSGRQWIARFVKAPS